MADGWGANSGFQAAMMSATVHGRDDQKNAHDLIKRHQAEIDSYSVSAQSFIDLYSTDPAAAIANLNDPNFGDPLERFLSASQSQSIATSAPGASESGRLQELLSLMVFNPMGYGPEESGNYGWGELAYIYQMTPSTDVARQVQSWRAEGNNLKADLAELYYGSTNRPEDQGLDSIRRLTSKYGHGQTDVAMNPNLVNQMMSRRTTDRSRRQYKGGTVAAGLLTSPALGFKKQLGG